MTASAVDLRPTWLTAEWPWPVSAVDTAEGPVAVTDTGVGPVVLLVHAGLTGFVWRDLVHELRGDHRCVVVDAPGNGLSPRPDPAMVGVRSAAAAVAEVVAALDLREITLVFHDLGGPAAVAGAADSPDRVRRLVAVNTFAWPPSGRLLRTGLAVMGSAPVRASDSALRWMALVSATRVGVARRWTTSTRRAYRRLLDREASAALHRYFRSAWTEVDVLQQADDALRGPLADRPVLTAFGRRNDYFGFQAQWQDRFPSARQEQVPGGNHFPMCDDPVALAGWVRDA